MDFDTGGSAFEHERRETACSCSTGPLLVVDGPTVVLYLNTCPFRNIMLWDVRKTYLQSKNTKKCVRKSEIILGHHD